MPLKNIRPFFKENTFNLTMQYLEKYGSTYSSWYPGASIKWMGKKSYWLEEGEKVEDGRAEGSSAVRDGRQTAISLTPYEKT